jgi:hypothetical protein
MDHELEKRMDPIDPIAVSANIAEDYRRYLSSLISPQDPKLAAGLRKAIAAAATEGLTKGPYLEVTPPYATGSTVRELINQGVLTERFARFASDAFPLDRPVYKHQETAIRQIADGRNAIVATGTGSGKTESFLIPILNHLQKEASEGSLTPGVRALLLYPMNALANDQLKRLRQMLAETPEITFGRYTGETEEEAGKAEKKFEAQHPGVRRLPNELLSREEMRATPPHLLLTNYSMLEYLLLRPVDMDLFESESNTWKFLVADEAHVYDGATGAEVAFLIRRLRERVKAVDALQYIATSATVGNDLDRAADFAKSLFGAQFSGDADVVTATRLPWGAKDVWGRLSSADIASRLDDDDLIDAASRRGASTSSLHATLAGEATLTETVQLASENPRTLKEILNRIGPDADVTATDLRDLVSLGPELLTRMACLYFLPNITSSPAQLRALLPAFPPLARTWVWPDKNAAPNAHGQYSRLLLARNAVEPTSPAQYRMARGVGVISSPRLQSPTRSCGFRST